MPVANRSLDFVRASRQLDSKAAGSRSRARCSRATVRVADIYVPAEHNGEGLLLLADLIGFTGSGLPQTNWSGFRENPPVTIATLFQPHSVPSGYGRDTMHQISLAKRSNATGACS